jgi:hypothetical protein
MAGSLQGTPTFALQPSANRIPTATNYLSDFNFANQYLPDTYEKEFERYGNRTVSSFMRLVGAEIPSASDLIKWAEQGRLHIAYNDVSGTIPGAPSSAAVTFTVNDVLDPVNGNLTPGTASNIGFRVGQTVVISDGTNEDKGVITATAAATTFEVTPYANWTIAAGAGTGLDVFIYGSEFQKGTSGMADSIEPSDEIFDNKPIILKDKYSVSGSDMAFIGWIEVTTEDGATGYLWYLKAEHETRLRFEDYLETSMVEAVKVAAGTAAATAGYEGSEGIFSAVETRGNLWSGGNPDTLAEFDTVIKRLDKQGAIEENVLFVNREFSFDIDDMLAAQNSYGAGGTSYGLFDNDEQMALNLGFSGFRRGYDFYKSDWKYLNDPTMRGLMTGTGVDGLLVPAGTTSVYDQVLGKNAKRPFLHVRYRASQAEDRRMKTWITGSAGGARTSDLDAMEVNFLSERCVCVMGANNFVLFKK